MKWDVTNRAKLSQLLAEGKTQKACAQILRCRPSAISAQLHPEKKPTLLPSRVLHGSCPMKRRIDYAKREAQRALRPLTKSEMRDMLSAAVRNTAQQ